MPNSNITETHTCIVGAGAAGLFAAGELAQRGIATVLIDHRAKPAEKIRISGGGYCNFTNRDLNIRQPDRYFLGQNPRFCRSALSRYTPADFIALVESHGIAYHEKHKGQLFCDRSAQDIIDMLLQRCTGAPTPTTLQFDCTVERIDTLEDKTETNADSAGFELHTSAGTVRCQHLVIATGGLSIPKIGASDWGYRIAKQFGHSIVPTQPALVPLTCSGDAWQAFSALSGISLPVQIRTPVQTKGKAKKKAQHTEFDEDLLFTHKGLSGPASLQISSYWMQQHPTLPPITINCLAQLEQSGTDWLPQQKQTQPQKQIGTVLQQAFPKRLAQAWLEHWQNTGLLTDAHVQTSLSNLPNKLLHQLQEQLEHWSIQPTGTEGYKKAEVTVGGVSTAELSSSTMESKLQSRLYFIGEVMDITGWLGGYNFQWAWASAAACARGIAESGS